MVVAAASAVVAALEVLAEAPSAVAALAALGRAFIGYQENRNQERLLFGAFFINPTYPSLIQTLRC